ncbi:hypothetical protein [uncultured Methanobrevibacter sp.]|uniref:hypothetical protein n=1 Tax=uncultured Methanobrevibacter sp. TaxID=253161 RepID=UPI0025D6A4A4|nr:hypothetical protein [uncultured Methanobrevibacter sp.]
MKIESIMDDDRKFTRTRKISFKEIIFYPLLQKGCTNSSEANRYMRLIMGDLFAMISQQAIGEKRGFLNPDLYEDIYKDFIDHLYVKFHKELLNKEYIHLV